MTNALVGDDVPKPILSAEPSIKKACVKVSVSNLKSTDAPDSLNVNPPPSKSIAPVALTPPTTCNSVEGEFVFIPILSLPASVKNKFASPLPSILKSKSADDSLNTKVPPSKITLPATVQCSVGRDVSCISPIHRTL